MQQLQGAFPAIPGGQTCLADLNSPAGSNGWTPGKQTLATTTAQATIARPWTIYGWGIRGFGVIAKNASGGANQNPYGRLGKIVAAILPASAASQQANQPFTPPPPEAAPYLATVWDGSSDPLFPYFDNVNQNSFPVTGLFATTQQLPQPVGLNPAEQIAVGMWLTPSLVNNTEIIIFQATYTILYDVERGR